jgi:hypothetical protein
MHTINDNSSTHDRRPDHESVHDRASAAGNALPLLAGAAVGIGGFGAVLALADLASPLRAPFTLFFLLAAPAAALAMLLRGLDPLSRCVVALAGAAAADVLIAQTMLALDIWSIRGGTAAVAALGLLLLLPALVRLRRDRAARTRTS